jgi:PAS domain S-box-containing protein
MSEERRVLDEQIVSPQSAADNRSEERIRSLVDQASVGMALESLEGEIFHVNPAFCRMLGYTEEELRTMRCSDFSHPEDDQAELILFAELREGRRNSYQIDKRFRSKNGEWVWARVSISLLRTQDNTPMVVGIVEDIRERRQADEQLKAAKLELEELAGRLLRAQEEERYRISRELHDDIGQRMTLIIMEIDELEEQLRTNDKAMLLEQTTSMKSRLQDLASAIHDMCRNLHSPKLDYLGLGAALDELGRDIFRHSRLSVHVAIDDDANRLPADVTLCLYRVVQEALNNVSKHSKISRAEVCAKRVGDFIRLTITDCGAGFDLSAPRSSAGIGLASMRERLRAVNGTFMITSVQGAGTQVIAEVKYLPSRKGIDSRVPGYGVSH